MPSIDKIIPRYLNSDDDERLIKRTEMVDAQNVRVSVDSEIDAQVLKNAWGNISRADTIENGTIPAGSNVVIGSIADEQSSQIYYFVWNSSTNHTIFRYDQNAKKTFIVYQDSVLQFTEEGHVDADIIRLSNGNILLYFNDSLTQPKKINTNLAEQSISGSGGYPANFLSGSDTDRLAYITAAKAQPLVAPIVTFQNNSASPQNDIFEKNFQFSYQYEYFDGEQSALGPYSELAISKSQLKDGFINAGARNFFNEAKIQVTYSAADVSEINIYARIGDKDAPFFLIETIPNVNSGGTQNIFFRNDSNYVGLSSQTQDKRYDNLPQKADSQALSQGRLFYGGYTENYDNLPFMDVDSLPNYNAKPNTFEITVSKNTTLQPNLGSFIDIDFSNIPFGGVTEDSKVLLSFNWNDGAMVIRNVLNNTNDFNFIEDLGKFEVFSDAAGSNKVSSTQAEKMAAMAGLRTIATGGGAGNQTGLNLGSGVLNLPPQIRFIAQKGTSDTTEESVGIKKIKKGIKVISSGFQVREIIDIPANSTRSQIQTLVNTAIEGLYPTQLMPQQGEAGFSTFTTGFGTRATVESAAFSGSGEVWFRRTNPNPTTGIDTYKLSLSLVTMKVDKLVFGTREAEVIQPFGVQSTFDLIESNINGEQALINSGSAFRLVPTANGFYLTNTGANISGRNASIERNGGYITQGGSFAIANDDMDGNKCFKSGSNHELGLIYFDDKGRAGGVQPLLEETFVQHTNNRVNQNNLDGYADITMRIRHTAPTWASRFSVVYAGQGSIVNKIQYSIGGAYLALNDAAEGGFGAAQNIYLSLGTLQSRNNSYDNQLGADISYGFAEGDRVRIVRYGDNIKETKTWRVSRLTTLLASPTTNPILDRSSKASIQNTTGDFLVLEDNNTFGWNTASIMDNNSNWNNQCVIEIFRESDAFNNMFYYEIGENLSIDSAGVHQTNRISTSTTLKIISQSGNEVVALSAIRLFKGDQVQTAGGESITIGNVVDDDSESGYTVRIYGNTTDTWTPTNIYAVTVQNPDSVFNIDQGDSYFRLRTLFYASAPRKGDVWRNMSAAFSQNALVDFIEDPRVSDFFKSDYTSLGKSFAYLPDARTIKRYGSITYSDPFAFDQSQLGLSSFNISLLNFSDLSYDYGSIKSMVSHDQLMYVIHERRAGVVPVKRNILTADSGEALVNSNMVLGPANYYTGEYGVNNNPESVAQYRGQIYFMDSRAGKVLRIGKETGITVISEVLVDGFFKQQTFSTALSAKNKRYHGGIDRENTEYIISSPALFTSRIAIDDSCAGTQGVGNARTNASGAIINVTPIYDDSLTFFFNTEVRQWECDFDTWDTAGSGLLLIDQLTSNPIVGISENYSPSQSTSLTTDIPVVMTTSQYTAFYPCTFNQLTGVIEFRATEPTGSITVSDTSETLPAFTIAYNLWDKFWSTRYSYNAEGIISLTDRMYTFNAGKIFEHSPDVPKNTFYGITGDTIVEVVSNFNPSMIKVYEALSLEGNNSDWTVTLKNSDQTSAIASSIWDEKENFYYASIHQDSTNNVTYTSTADVTTVSGTSEVFSLGEVDALPSPLTDKITFKNAINNQSFPLGDSTALYLLNVAQNKLEPLNLYAVSVSGEKELTCNATISGFSAGDTLVLIANSAIEGDSIRDYYLQAKFVNSNTTPHELYAINFIYTKSNLHNQQGQ